MSKSYIPKAVRDQVAAEARYRCGYCQTQESIVGTPMEVEHIVPEAAGGPTEVDNLWLACSQCNVRKSDRVRAKDPLTGEVVPLFDPRHQEWLAHFAWTAEGSHILRKTPTDRATIVALELNRAPLVSSRRLWVIAGWHPPND